MIFALLRLFLSKNDPVIQWNWVKTGFLVILSFWKKECER